MKFKYMTQYIALEKFPRLIFKALWITRVYAPTKNQSQYSYSEAHFCENWMIIKQ